MTQDVTIPNSEDISPTDIHRGADLSDADLSDADLSHADLSDTDLSDADLSDASLTLADLRGADLTNADLSDADLRRADLNNADVSDADLSDALRYAHLQKDLKTTRATESGTQSSGVTESGTQSSDTFAVDVKQLQQQDFTSYSKSRVLSALREMDPYEFEQLVAQMWTAQGWDAKVTSGAADRGTDVIATKQDAFERRRHLIQIKRHGENTAIGSEDIQRYAGLYARDEDVDAVFVVTSNRFTSEAKTVADNRDVTLINADELYEMLCQT